MSRSPSEPPADDDEEFLSVTLMPFDEKEARPSKPSLVGRELDDRYRLIELLGKGGAGEVYRAIPSKPGPSVAIKVMRREVAANKEQAGRFRREARAGSLLAHRNIIRVLELAEDHTDGTFFIVMELLSGKNLGSHLASSPAQLPIRDVLSMFWDILEAVAVAHEAGVVHRDLKPDNVFLAETDHGVVVKVLDFGLARISAPGGETTTLTTPNALAGTPEYMSPEQCRSLHVGPSTDLYALGCVLTEMLQKKPLFTGHSNMDVIAKQLFARVPPLERPEGAEPVPPSLEALRLALLEKDAEKRPKDARAVQSMLRPLSVMPPPNVAR